MHQLYISRTHLDVRDRYTTESITESRLTAMWITIICCLSLRLGHDATLLLCHYTLFMVFLTATINPRYSFDSPEQNIAMNSQPTQHNNQINRRREKNVWPISNEKQPKHHETRKIQDLTLLTDFCRFFEFRMVCDLKRLLKNGETCSKQLVSCSSFVVYYAYLKSIWE